MSTSSYVIGCALVLAVVVALTYGASGLRGALLPGWSGAPARLAEVVIALSIAVVVGEALGAISWFGRGAVLAGLLGAGVGLGELGRRRHPPRIRRAPSTDAPPSRFDEAIAATAALALVALQWMSEVGFAFGKGMTHPDTAWYHGPYAAQFVQRNKLVFNLDRTDPLHAFAGHTSELLHATLMLLVRRDLLSPLVGVGFAVVAVLAAWCIGRRRGVGALCVLATAAVLGLPMITATQPGQGSNDIVAGALLLTAVALLLEGDFALAPTMLAGLAAGLALGTKITAGAPVAVLSIGVVVLAMRRHLPRIALAWCAALLLTGSFWFARNAIVAQNPLPYFGIQLGPLHLSRALTGRHDAVARYLFDGERWRGFFIPGFRRALSIGWLVVLLLALFGCVTSALRRRARLDQIVGLAMLAGLVGYLFTPFTADGGGLAFTFNVRYMTPALLGSLTIAPLAVAGSSLWLRRAIGVTFLAIVVVSATARHYERIPAWPATGRSFGIVVVGLVVVAVALRRRGLAIGVAVVVIVIVAGWPLQRHYFAHRYVAAGIPLDRVDAALRTARHARVGVFGTSETYPFFGADLSNKVEQPAAPVLTAPGERCTAWIDRLRTLGYDYIVIAHVPFGVPGPDEGWIAHDASVTRITGDEHGTLYRVDAPLRGNRCSHRL